MCDFLVVFFVSMLNVEHYLRKSTNLENLFLFVQMEIQSNSTFFRNVFSEILRWKANLDVELTKITSDLLRLTTVTIKGGQCKLRIFCLSFVSSLRSGWKMLWEKTLNHKYESVKSKVFLCSPSPWALQDSLVTSMLSKDNILEAVYLSRLHWIFVGSFT